MKTLSRQVSTRITENISSAQASAEMENASVKLTKGQKKKLKLKSKREAEAASTNTPGPNGSKPRSGGPAQQQGSSKASRKRPVPGSAGNESSRIDFNGAANGIVTSKKKKRSDANESLAMQRRSKSYASQSEPASTQKFKAAQAHAPSSKKLQPSGEGNACASSGSKNKGGGGDSGGVLSGGSKGLTSLQERMRAKLEGAKFRMINEELYTSTGSAAFQRYQDDPSLFEIYHRGYREQVAKWPENPLSAILGWLKTLKDNLVVADFGCGDAVLARDAPPNVEKCHSFDLVSVNSRVVACDMANVPLADASTDVCVFCLSLMGTNLADYLREAKRVLKQHNGLLKVTILMHL